ncbi:MAG: HEAT repeat domain-containing protein, partial [Cyanobium sp.]
MPAEDLPPPAPFADSSTDLVLDPEVLAAELAQELLGDPLDEIYTVEAEAVDIAAVCDWGLQQLVGGQDERLQGLRIFCEHRDPRSIPLLLPLLSASCPIVRMSA